jgi:hypothetical protein
MKLNIAFGVLVVLFAMMLMTRLGHGFNPKLLLAETLFDPITWALVAVGYFWQKRRVRKAS